MAAECICVYMQFYQGTAFIFRNKANSDLCNGDSRYFLRGKKLIFGSRDSSVGIATGYGVDDRVPVG
jgi:hypothetical protein